MIEESSISLNFIKKEPLTGSERGMRYRMYRGEDGESGAVMEVTIWPEPYCFEKTDDSQKQTAQFALTEEGKREAVEWLNRQYEEQKDRWERGPGVA